MADPALMHAGDIPQHHASQGSDHWQCHPTSCATALAASLLELSAHLALLAHIHQAWVAQACDLQNQAGSCHPDNIVAGYSTALIHVIQDGNNLVATQSFVLQKHAKTAARWHANYETCISRDKVGLKANQGNEP